MTPTPPPYGQWFDLQSGATLLLVRSWNAGELLVGLAVLALAALVLLDWAYGLVRGKP